MSNLINRIRIRIGLACVLLAIALPFGAAQANHEQMQCGDRPSFVKHMVETGGARLGMGLDVEGNMLELWSTEDGVLFAIMVTDTEGNACVVIQGNDWETFPYEAPGAPSEGS